MTCPHAPSGCNYPESECAGLCLAGYAPKPVFTLPIIPTVSGAEQNTASDSLIAVVAVTNRIE